MHHKNYITQNYSFIHINFTCNLMLSQFNININIYHSIKTKSPINCLVELRNNYNKVANEITFH